MKTTVRITPEEFLYLLEDLLPEGIREDVKMGLIIGGRSLYDSVNLFMKSTTTTGCYNVPSDDGFVVRQQLDILVSLATMFTIGYNAGWKVALETVKSRLETLDI